jgi:predicted nuclease of predicted toxin-antitoxin system
MLKFIVDTQLPPKLSDLFNNFGFDSIHTIDLPFKQFTSDDQIINIAKNQSRIIITKDKDFFDNYFLKGAPPKILLLTTGNISNSNLLELFKMRLQNIADKFDNNADIVILSTNKIISF